jgi:hypothetical protein
MSAPRQSGSCPRHLSCDEKADYGRTTSFVPTYNSRDQLRDNRWIVSSLTPACAEAPASRLIERAVDEIALVLSSISSANSWSKVTNS